MTKVGRNAPCPCGSGRKYKHCCGRAAAPVSVETPAVHVQAGMQLRAQGRPWEALAEFDKALAIQPKSVEASNARANLLFELGDYERAQDQYRHSLRLDASDWGATYNLAQASYRCGDYDAAAAAYRQALQIRPDDVRALANLASLLEQTHHLAEAAEAVARLRSQQPRHVMAAVVGARLARREGDVAGGIAMLREADPQTVPPADRVSCFSELGRLHEMQHDYREAFASYAAGKASAAQAQPVAYDERATLDRLAATTGFVANGRFEAVAAPPVADSVPVSPLFVVGFYRSGSTLLEQVLACHPQVAAGDELTVIERAERQIADRLGGPYPNCLLAAEPARQTEVLDAARRDAAAAYAALAEAGKPWLVDKQLFNVFRLPTIRLLFPDAPVLHCLRHPLDVALSSYFTVFMARNDWSYDLTHIARLQLASFDAVAAARERLDLRLRTVRYESLVEEPDTEIRALLDWLGLAWDDRCLRPHENTRIARTASYEQVTRPLYRDARYRYRNYLELLDPGVIELLTPALDRLGYRIDSSPS